MVHGLVVSGSYFDPLLDHLDIPNPIFVPDLPGFGRSTSTQRARSIDGMATMLAAWMDAHGIVDAILVANSLGCQIVTALAVTRPDLVSRYILISPTIDPIATSIPHIALRAALDIPRERQSLWRIWLGDLARSGLRRAIRTLAMGIADPQIDRLSGVRQPGLVVGGEHDPIVTRHWIRTMAESLGDARAIEIPGAPHALNFSSPRELARLIRVAVEGKAPDADQSGAMNQYGMR
jgi:pimeloyl-ACP methyl ester carboxylesterase